MPLSSNEETNELAREILVAIHALFGTYPGLRSNHAKGTLVSGHLQPSAEARSLSTAPHFNQPSTPITVRFSDNTGIPMIPDNDPNGSPKGMALRFHLGDRKHTDIVAHGSPFFPVNNGPDFLTFLKLLTAGRIPEFLSTHPAALAFVQAPKPIPHSFATNRYFGVHATKFINKEGNQTFFRYQIAPDAGLQTYTDEELQDKTPDFLFEELRERLKSGPATFHLQAQIAEEGDKTDDATVHWPESRKLVTLGTLTLDSVIEDNAELQRTMIFDPIPRVEGIEPSDDPLPELRATAYLIAGRERRAAGPSKPLVQPH